MTKTFLFDMDGVLVDSETMWDQLGFDQLLVDYFGKELASQVFVKSGMSFKGIFDEFTKLGWKGTYADFHQVYLEMGNKIYRQVAITDGVEALLTYLDKQGYQLGVVSSSPEIWIADLVSRIKNQHLFKLKLSVNVHPTLLPKPAPDPYLFAMKKLKTIPQKTIILEDSVAGVTSGKASGATVICFTGHANPNYVWQSRPENADFYARTMEEVGQIVAKIGMQ